MLGRDCKVISSSAQQNPDLHMHLVFRVCLLARYYSSHLSFIENTYHFRSSTMNTSITIMCTKIIFVLSCFVFFVFCFIRLALFRVSKCRMKVGDDNFLSAPRIQLLRHSQRRSDYVYGLYNDFRSHSQ